MHMILLEIVFEEHRLIPQEKISVIVQSDLMESSEYCIKTLR